MSAKIRILLVDDHPFLRDGVAQFLNTQPKYVCCGTAESPQEALTAIESKTPQFVILDLRLKGGDGLNLLKTIRVDRPNLPVLIFSQMDESVYAMRCLRAGANGYLMKEAGAQELLVAVERILSGKLYVSTIVNELLLRDAIESRSATVSPASTPGKLTDREMQVLGAIGSGMKNKEVASALSLSVKTIETYRENIKAKLNLRNSEELLKYAQNWVASGSSNSALSA